MGSRIELTFKSHSEFQSSCCFYFLFSPLFHVLCFLDLESEYIYKVFKILHLKLECWRGILSIYGFFTADRYLKLGNYEYMSLPQGIQTSCMYILESMEWKLKHWWGWNEKLRNTSIQPWQVPSIVIIMVIVQLITWVNPRWKLLYYIYVTSFLVLTYIMTS